MTAPTPVALSQPHPEPRTYPLMLRTWTYTWWRPLVGVVLLVLGMLVVVPVLLLPLLAGLVALDHQGSFSKAFEDAASLKHVTWQGMLYLNLVLAALVLVPWGIERVVHRLRPRWLSSVKPGLRWRF